ncbi:peptidylprolyl isomerase [Anopheles sinensis]|uniref:Peptidylprolyl isomerase n=1 Tax=Anopheles sinensis TaxID=74873 RepID=A0A084VN21_ANOSI|nr:peptidylprolyl isomerase [Anopheles sinensis]
MIVMDVVVRSTTNNHTLSGSAACQWALRLANKLLGDSSEEEVGRNVCPLLVDICQLAGGGSNEVVAHRAMIVKVSVFHRVSSYQTQSRFSYFQ